MVLRKVRIVSSSNMPMLIGLCLGIALSLILAPFLEESCSLQNSNDVQYQDQIIISRKTNSLISEDESFDYGNEDAFTPVIKKAENRNANSNDANVPKEEKKLLRARYASTELGIREKLFVSIVTSSETIEEFGVAVNKTLAHYVPKIVFFMGSRSMHIPKEMSIVSFTTNNNLKIYHMLKYIHAHHSDNYDYFYFASDENYVNGQHLMDLIGSLNIADSLHMGIVSPDSTTSTCSLRNGILLSRDLLQRVTANIEWCYSHAVLGDIYENLGKCFLHTTGAQCKNRTQDVEYQTIDLGSTGMHKNFNLEDDPYESAVVTKVTNHLDIYAAHRHVVENRLKVTLSQIDDLTADIIHTAATAPDNLQQHQPATDTQSDATQNHDEVTHSSRTDGLHSLTWPIGYDSSSVPKSRFDVISWEYFTETDIYPHGEHYNKHPITGIDRADIDDILEIAVEKFSKLYHNTLLYSHLSNGYRHFDPVRGMEYLLDLTFVDSVTQKSVIKRASLLRPLSKVEIVPMPYVTENSKINLVLPVYPDQSRAVVGFLESYAKTCLESGDNVNLYIVFVYHTSNDDVSDDDVYHDLKALISYYETKYMNGARITWLTTEETRDEQIDSFSIADQVAKRLSDESLMLLCSSNMDLSTEYLNRVRMSTIHGWQVFSPIAYWLYKPNLVYSHLPYPDHVDINKNSGHFDVHDYSQISFYASDYAAARARMMSNTLSSVIHHTDQRDAASTDIVHDLYGMFLRFSDLHVFRAVEPALVHQYVDKNCTGQFQTKQSADQCLIQQAESLASKQQLAKLVLDYKSSAAYDAAFN